MLFIKENVLEKRKWYQNPMTQAFNEQLEQTEFDTEDLKIDAYYNALLEAKGLYEDWEKDNFLFPADGEFENPFQFQQMELACEIIAQAISNDEHILVFGDYDCDGLTSTAIMVRLLRLLNARVSYFIPDRLEDGYGLSEKVLEQVFALQPDLVLTVDCGINSFDEINALMQNDIKVIVTDHHQPDVLWSRNALALINPQVECDQYPFAGLAGAGVAFKLAQGLVTYLQRDDIDLSFALCLAAVGTVADSMPLENENRVIVALATAVFKEKAPLGLRMLIDRFCSHGNIEASTFGFSIGPRLNAAGRMGELNPAIQLLLSDDANEIETYIDELENLNNHRKELEQEIFAEAVSQIEAMPIDERKHIIIVANQDWHSGITGIVSSRLMEKYSVPVITFAGSDGSFKGSARSIGAFDILAAISSAGELTETYGGHLQAAGVTVSENQYNDFRNQVLAYAKANPIRKSDLESYQYHFDLPHDMINDRFAEELTRFEPYGQKNEKPCFLLRNLIIEQWREVGQGRHISLTLRLENQRSISAIAFNAQEFSRLFKQNDKVDLLVNLNWQQWNGRFSSQLQVLDWRVSNLNSMIWDEASRIEELYSVNPQDIQNISQMYAIPINQFQVTVEQIQSVIKFIEQYYTDLEKGFNITILARVIARELKLFINPFILKRIFAMFEEAGWVSWQDIDAHNICSSDMEIKEHISDLEKTDTWQTLLTQELI